MKLRHRLFGVTVLWVTTVLACSFGGLLPLEATPVPPVAGPTQSAPTQPAPNNGDKNTVTVAKVVDGDTIELSDGRKIRYIGMNTPERNQPYYAEAKEMNQQLVGGRAVRLELDTESIDKYGRTLAYIWVGDVLVNLEIVRQGYANAFTVPPNVKYEAELRQAEREAREAERGLWAGSDVSLKIVNLNADAPGSDRDNPNGEWVEIANQGHETIQLKGYTLKDEANHIYTFGVFELKPGTSFRLYSGQGQNTATELYWGYVGESVWNNDKDTAFLRDEQGALVDVFTY